MDLIHDLKTRLREENSHFDPKKGPRNAKHILSKPPSSNLAIETSNSMTKRPSYMRLTELLNTILEQNEEHVSDRAPPLDIIIYALKDILYPTFLPELMSEFLQLFTMVEFYRIRATEKAALAREMNTFYKTSPDPIISLLTIEEEKYIERLIESRETMREIYMEVVAECCVLDLQRQWLVNSNTDFWIRWNEYLSVLNGTNDKPPSHSFHHKLSTDEIDGLRNAALRVWEFLKTTVEAGQQQLIEGQSIHQAINGGDLEDAYLPKEIPSDILEAIDYHQQVVKEAVERFNVEDENQGNMIKRLRG